MRGGDGRARGRGGRERTLEGEGDKTEMEEQVRKGGKRRTKREEEDRGEEGRSRVSAENRELGATSIGRQGRQRIKGFE